MPRFSPLGPVVSLGGEASSRELACTPREQRMRRACARARHGARTHTHTHTLSLSFPPAFLSRAEATHLLAELTLYCRGGKLPAAAALRLHHTAQRPCVEGEPPDRGGVKA
jgi:hypothetical protein